MSSFNKVGMYVITIVLGAILVSDGYSSSLLNINSPEEGKIFEGGTPYQLNIDVHHTSDNDVGFQFEWRPLTIPGQFPPGSNYKKENVQILKKEQNYGGIKWNTRVQVLLPKGGDWRIKAWQQLPKPSPSPLIETNYRQFQLIDSKQLFFYGEISASPSNYTGPCPVDIHYSAYIGSAMKGRVFYQFIRSWDSASTPVMELKFDEPSLEYISGSYPYPVSSSDPTSGWIAMKVFKNNLEFISNHADFSLICLADLDPGQKKFSIWKSLPELSPPPLSCQTCVSIFKQITDIDQKSMPLVREGEVLIADDRQHEAKVQRLKEIESLLESNMIKRRALVDQYNQQKLKYQILHRKPTSQKEH